MTASLLFGRRCNASTDRTGAIGGAVTVQGRKIRPPIAALDIIIAAGRPGGAQLGPAAFGVISAAGISASCSPNGTVTIPGEVKLECYFVPEENR